MAGIDLRSLWDFSDPAGSERRFRDRLAADPGLEVEQRSEILSQIARALGLQHDFDAASDTLDEAAALLGDEPAPLARARLALERGRLHNSAGNPAAALPHFQAAHDFAETARAISLQIDALHMLAIASPQAQQLGWNERALALAEGSDDPGARRWVAPLLNNAGWAYHERGDYAAALAHFERAVPLRRAAGQARETRIAEWAVASCLRSLDRCDEALTIQQRLEREWDADGEPNPYVFEEIGECLLALGRAGDARPYFARAHAALSADPWFVAHEPDRLARLQELAG